MSALDCVSKEYIVILQGRSHPTYPGVLDAAMKAGLLELTVKVVQAPSAENGQMAICEAMATFPGPDGRERIFAEVGDANPGNVNRMIAPHVLRMAATRAKGRCLRDALGIGVALAEEMSNGEADQPATNGHAVAGRKAGSAPASDERERLKAEAAAGQVFCSECGVEIGPNEASASFQRGWPMLCQKHGYARNMRERAEKAAA